MNYLSISGVYNYDLGRLVPLWNVSINYINHINYTGWLPAGESTKNAKTYNITGCLWQLNHKPQLTTTIVNLLRCFEDLPASFFDKGS